ncbi:DUF4435 domain-containing protein [Vibrio harveyi]|uniref:DUF4435 domain-containing protein n=1 Tax=Vibrio TaxID=662 RepID=UPI001EF39D35|nr:DUF4435 domain-containing protein [Vibrio sp. MMH1-50]MCG7517915.1 DUF4435 domain-containing protein [Vibrio sp. MMH1-50]
MSTLANNITPDRIVNAIMMDRKFNGYNLLVEGAKDQKLYGKFISKDATRIISTDGKYKMRSAWEKLDERGITNKFAIRDADFIRVRDKYISDYDKDIFLTDRHDSECMIIDSPCFDIFLETILTEEQHGKVKQAYPDLKSILEEQIYNLGCLKLANKIDSLGLVFKPKQSSGKNIDFTKFIDTKSMLFKSNKDLINAVINYSINKVEKGTIKSLDDIETSLNKVIDLELPLSEIVHGHDFAELIYILLRKKFKFNLNLINNSDNVETLLTMSYDTKFFEQTNLYLELKRFSDERSIQIFSF